MARPSFDTKLPGPLMPFSKTRRVSVTPEVTRKSKGFSTLMRKEHVGHVEVVILDMRGPEDVSQTHTLSFPLGFPDLRVSGRTRELSTCKSQLFLRKCVRESSRSMVTPFAVPGLTKEKLLLRLRVSQWVSGSRLHHLIPEDGGMK